MNNAGKARLSPHHPNGVCKNHPLGDSPLWTYRLRCSKAQAQKCDSAEMGGLSSIRGGDGYEGLIGSTDLDDPEGTEHNHTKEQYSVGKERQ